jgi:hypothetical protein
MVDNDCLTHVTDFHSSNNIFNQYLNLGPNSPNVQVLPCISRVIKTKFYGKSYPCWAKKDIVFGRNPVWDAALEELLLFTQPIDVGV